MKRAVLIFGLALLAALSIFLFVVVNPDFRLTEVDFEDIPVVPFEQADAGIPSDDGTGSDEEGSAPVFEISYLGMILPDTDGKVLIPVLPETGLTVVSERGATLTKAQMPDGAWQITARKGDVSRSVTLTETGIGVATLALTDSPMRDPSDPIGETKEVASLSLLYADDAGKLTLETAQVSVAIRGQISRKYAKKSYTVSFGSKKCTPRSLMGLPADTRYALNSMYLDGSKTRDALTLSMWRGMAAPDDTADVTSFRYLELFIDGEYRGLYGLHQTVTPLSAGVSGTDGLVKIAHPLYQTYAENLSDLKANLEVLQTAPATDIADIFAKGLAGLSRGEEDALSLFDTDSLMRVFLFAQVTYAKDNIFQNMAGIWHSDRKVFTIFPFDTHFSMGYEKATSKKWTEAKTFDTDISTVYPDFLKPIMGILLYDGRFKKPLAELYFSLRETVLSEETLLSEAKELFDKVTASGAREREHIRWPKGGYAETNALIEAFIPARLAWCDEYFGAMLEEGQTGAQAG